MIIIITIIRIIITYIYKYNTTNSQLPVYWLWDNEFRVSRYQVTSQIILKIDTSTNQQIR